MRHAQLLVEIHRTSRGLLAVAQGGIEDVQPVHCSLLGGVKTKKPQEDSYGPSRTTDSPQSVTGRNRAVAAEAARPKKGKSARASSAH
jgi:hypothetical protein